MSESRSFVAEQFDDLPQQEEASRLGMWTFLATEILFFGGLFTSYLVYRSTYPQAFATGSEHGNVLIGTINTAILLTSSFTMALSVHAAQEGKNKKTAWLLLLTLLFGLAFLGLKGLEYSEHISEHMLPGAHFTPQLSHPVEMYFYLYFVMTGLHSLHVLVGVGVLAFMLLLAWRKRFSAEYHTPMEISGLYWHFVDLVWVFLYPLFYLIHK